METFEYKASIDTLAKIITVGVFVLFIFLGRNNVKTLLNFNEIGTSTILINTTILIFFIVVLIWSYLYSPRGYAIKDSLLLIRRYIGSKTIDLIDIIEVRRLKDREMAWTIRTWGVGGLFGYYGRFYNRALGHMTYYVTQRKNMILLRTKTGKKIIISPDDINMADKLGELIPFN